MRKIYGIAGALSMLAVPFFIMLSSHEHIETEQSLCPFKMVTGFPCPGCGITKSIIFFYQGDLLKSLEYHVLGPFVPIASIIAILVLLAELVTQKNYFSSILYSTKLAYALAILLGTYHSIRLVIFISTHTVQQILTESIWQ
ncbi:MAG: DUF2752 domain-containing protein [Algoriphagus sp.]|nr:DUF2752 domain-containing protein [Algoriphagus sp.]MCE2779539.1 DUF2752 domain-containing protein [Algoriphagus sp.]